MKPKRFNNTAFIAIYSLTLIVGVAGIAMEKVPSDTAFLLPIAAIALFINLVTHGKPMDWRAGSIR